MAAPSEGAQPNEITANVERVGKLIAQKKQQLAEKLSVLSTIIQPVFDPESRLQSLQIATRTEILRLPTYQAAIERIIASQGIETPIDAIFVEDILIVADIVPHGGDDALFASHLREIVTRAWDNLKLRRLSQRMEAEGEKEHAVEISSGRIFKFHLSEDQERVRMDFPLVADPSKENVKLGPEAVVQILGAPLTITDYDNIAQTLLSLPGQAGQVMRAYFQAVDTWAELAASGVPSEAARESRFIRSVAVRQVVGGTEDPNVSPFCDIPLNAIFLKARNKYREMNKGPLPQPFEN
ncbi:hypothetical protein HY024_01290 [Candidatus Curtissbacteria bacterium]|nr:hypothetical protein [Candidatus Curtissbacteria bacterium]